MGKLSALSQESTFSLSDFFVKVKGAGAGDVLVTLQNIINAIGGKTSTPYKFSGYRAAAATSGNLSFALVQFDTELFDTGSNFDIATNKGRFTAPVAGFYQFNSFIEFPNVNSQAAARLYKNGSFLQDMGSMTLTTSSDGVLMGNAFVQAAANDYFEIYALGGAALSLVVGSGTCGFSGYIVCAT